MYMSLETQPSPPGKKAAYRASHRQQNKPEALSPKHSTRNLALEVTPESLNISTREILRPLAGIQQWLTSVSYVLRVLSRGGFGVLRIFISLSVSALRLSSQPNGSGVT